MKNRKQITMILLFVFGAFSAVYFSCNKSNPPSTTRTICVTCANGGICKNDTCRCPLGYEGSECFTQSREKFIGSWNVNESGTSSGARTYQIDIEENFTTDSIYMVQIENFYNKSSINYINAQTIGDSLIIPTQYFTDYNNFVYKVTGIGYIHSDPTFGSDGGITVRYVVYDTTHNITDDFGYLNTSGNASQWIRN